MSVPEVKLGELGELRNGLNYSKANTGTGLKVISVKNFGDLRTPNYSELEEINPDGLNTKDSRLKAGDVIFVRSNGNKDLIGRSMFIEEDQSDVSFSGFCIRFRNTSSRARSKYLAYFFRSPVFRRALSNLGGGVNINNLNQKVLANFPIPLPELDAQDHILSVISAYDVLIENNRRRIALLEQAARLLYREWFVHFRFPGHETATFVDGLPEGWEMKSLSDLAHMTMGQSPKSEFYNETGEGLPFHQGVTNYGFRFVEDKTYSSVVTKLAEAGDILFSVRAPVGRINFTMNKIVLGRGLAAFRSKTNHQSFLFYNLKNHFFKEDLIGGGAIFAATNKRELEKLMLLQPAADLLDEFETKASAIDAQIKALTLKTRKLIKARDLLLPRLMDGRISVDV